jgi:hypothetical protein
MNVLLLVRFQVLTAASMKFRVFWDVAPSSHVEANDVTEVRTASIIRAMMEVVCTSETSVDNNFTRQYIPEDNSEHQRHVSL